MNRRLGGFDFSDRIRAPSSLGTALKFRRFSSTASAVSGSWQYRQGFKNKINSERSRFSGPTERSPFRHTARDGRRKHVVTSRSLTRTYLCSVVWPSETVCPVRASSSHARRDRVGRRSFEIFIGVGYSSSRLVRRTTYRRRFRYFAETFPFALYCAHRLFFITPKRQRSNA